MPIPFLGPCPASGATEFMVPFIWQNHFTAVVPDAPRTFTSPTLRGGLWDIYWSYVEPVSFRIHRAAGTDPWISQNIYDGFDPSFGASLLRIMPDAGLDPLNATASSRGEVPFQSGIRIGTGIPQEGQECDCAIDTQGTGVFDFTIQHRYSYTLAQWAAFGVPSETTYLIHGYRVGN